MNIEVLIWPAVVLILGLLSMYLNRPLINLNTGTQWNTWNKEDHIRRLVKTEERLRDLQNKAN